MKLRHKLLGMGLGVAVLWGSPIVIRPAQVLAQTENQQDIKAQADQFLNQGIEQYRKSDFRGALISWEKSLGLYRQIGDRQREAGSLGNLGLAFNSLGEYQRAIAFLHQSLDIARAIGYQQQEINSLGNLGNAHQSLGEYQEAITFYQQSLEIAREIGNRKGEANSLGNLGNSYLLLSEYQQAIDFLKQQLEIAREIGDRQGEAKSLGNLGNTYLSLSEYQKAISFHKQSVEIAKEIGDRQWEGSSLGNLGIAYQSLGEYEQAIFFHQQHLEIAKDIGDRRGEAESFGSLGNAYLRLSEYGEAIFLYQQSLEIAKDIGDRRGESSSLIALGTAYFGLGAYQKARVFYQQALNIHREIGNRSGEASSLDGLGIVNFRLEAYQQAVNFYQQSVEIAREIGDRKGEGLSLVNLGSAYFYLGEYQRAIDFYEQSVEIAREIGDHKGEGLSLGNLGSVYFYLGEYQQAASFYEQWIAITDEIDDMSNLSLAYANIAKVFNKQEQPTLAIIFLKESTNIRESIRDGISGLDTSLQQTYLSTIEDDYRLLADLLLQQDRILEAQRVLDLLKVQELRDLFGEDIRSSDAEEYSDNDYRDPEKEYLQLQNQRIARAFELGKQKAALEDILKQNRNDAQQEQLRALRREEGEFIASFNDFIESPPIQKIIKELQQHLDTNESFNLSQAESLGNKLPENAAILYPLVLEDRLELVLVSADAPPVRKTIEISRADLNVLISNARTTLREKKTDFTSLRQLHDILIAPIDASLKAANIETILYVPDRGLRYIPLAALTDGNQWLTEEYRINNITAISLTELKTQPTKQNRSILFAASSDAQTIDLGYRDPISFNPLPHAETEVQAIAKLIPGTEPPLINKDFTKDIVEDMNDYDIVHFATHGYFLPGKPKDSFLVFGNGDHATIDEMKGWSRFGNVELIVLSACQTALGDVQGSGIEILGLGYRLQSKGAKASMSSLWEVSDNSTEALMVEFYQNLQAGNSKAESLRLAQQALSQNPQYAHPFHWASFILIGNGL